MLVVENPDFRILSAEDACCKEYEYDADSNTTYCKKHMTHRLASAYTWRTMPELIALLKGGGDARTN